MQETKAATDPSRVVFWQLTASHLLLVSKITSCPFLSTRDQIQTKNELEHAAALFIQMAGHDMHFQLKKKNQKKRGGEVTTVDVDF